MLDRQKLKNSDEKQCSSSYIVKQTILSCCYQRCVQVIFVESEFSQNHKPFESESSQSHKHFESESSRNFSSRVRVMTWSSRVRVESHELSSHFESLVCNLESLSSHTKFHVFSTTLFFHEVAPNMP